jgi:lipopolysaccharide exporter
MQPSPVDPLAEDAPVPSGSIRDRVIEGSLLLVGLRWSMRALNIVRTIVLARFLAPADFGVFGMAMLASQPFQLLTAMDLDLALIRHRSTARADFDTAWTCRALQRLAVAAAMLLIAPLAAAYFATPELTTVVPAVALGVAIAAFENIGVVTFRKDLDFHKEFGFNALVALLTLALTVVVAVLTRNYWALVLSVIGERLMTTILSYVWHPYRPHVAFSAFRKLWSFGQWVPMQNLGVYVRNHFDAFLVARLFGAARMGAYNVAGSAAGVAAELLAPVSTTLFPGYARVAHDPARLTHAYIDALGMLASLFVPATIGIVLLAPTFVPAVLGAQWVVAVPIVQALAVFNGINGLSATVGHVLMALGRMRRLTVVIFGQLLLYVPALLAAALLGDPLGMALVRAAVALVVAPFLFGALTGLALVHGRDIARALWRPVIASAVMAAAIVLVRASLPAQGLLSLGAQVATGLACYAASLTLVWLAAGRPLGAERTAVEWLVRYLY